jgi:EAL domain-containing protein (putative c-di-GMP-specific phosphodiesterase class I)
VRGWRLPTRLLLDEHVTFGARLIHSVVIVTSARTEPGARAVLMAMATFARQTGAFVIAEGIEDEETLGFLRDLDTLDPHPRKIIQGGQGYNLGRPMPGVETRTLVPLPGLPVVESAAKT